MRRILLISILATIAALPASAQETCLAPAMHVDIVGMSSVEDAAGTVSTMLRMVDPNPPARVSGYNVYRSSTASTSPGSWGLLAFNVGDQNAATTDIEWSDETSAVSPTGIFYYRVAAYNGPCDAEGPWVRPSIEDADGDGVADEADPCPTTPEGAVLLAEGCSATDLLLHPEELVGAVREGLQQFLIDNAAATTPDPVLNSVDMAQNALEEVADNLRRVESCMAAETMATVVGHMDDVVVLLQEHLLTLDDGTRVTAGWPPPDRGVETGTDGSYPMPPPEYLYWAGQLFKFMSAHEEAVRSSGINDQVCASQGEPMDFSGRVRHIADRERMLELDDGQQLVLPWQLATEGEDLLAEDRPVDGTAVSFGEEGIGVATYHQTQVSPFPYIETSQYDDCLQLRVLPVQPLPGSPVPQPGWIRHSLEGYRRTDTSLALEARMHLMTEDTGCPGVVAGLGPMGENVRIDYHYELKLSYQPPTGSWISQAPLALRVSGDSHPIPLPAMNPLADATLYATKVKRTCLDGGLSLPVIDPENGNVVGTRRNWQCSSEQVVTSRTETLWVLAPQAHCRANYSTVLFDIEDHDPNEWRPTTVSSISLPVAETPSQVTFSAQGHRIVNGTPTAGAVSQFDEFAVYSPFGSIRPGYGTDRQSHLDWPHVTGTRNGMPFRYTCSLPELVTDMVQVCPGDPETFYRMPFELNADSHINQGNGGTASHNTWQWYALDIGRFQGAPIRAARGGKVVLTRNDMLKNCYQEPCDEGMPPGGQLEEYGNYVGIQHQDGTVSWYAHLEPGSPIREDDVVPRGTFLGVMGSTGRSTGPHLHFHVTPEDPALWGYQTIHARYEAHNLTDSIFQTCMEPQAGKDYRSTNRP